MSIWVCGGLVKLELLFHKTVFYNLLHFVTISEWCSGQHSCISCSSPGFNSPHGPTNFQLSFFSFSSFMGHKTFLLKTSNVKNHLSFRGESHESYKGASLKAYLLLQGLNVYYLQITCTCRSFHQKCEFCVCIIVFDRWSDKKVKVSQI